MKRILYLNKGGRKSRINSGGPTEFMYGLMELSKSDWFVDLCDETDLGMNSNGFISVGSFLNNYFYRFFGISLRFLFKLYKAENRSKFNSYDIIFVTTNSLGVSLCLLKFLRLIKPNVVFLAMGLIELNTPMRIVSIYKKILAEVTVCAISKSDQLMLTKQLSRRIESINFGVDINYWFPELGVEDYVLSIGNDRHRDYQTLIAAWKPHYPKLLIITKLPVDCSSANIEVRSGDCHNQTIDDAEIRRLIRASRFVILPIKNTVQPSGQSVCLQSMACEKTVVLTNFLGVWNIDLLLDKKTCVFSGAPGDQGGIQHAVELLLANPDLVREIGFNARMMVENFLSAQHMSDELSDIFLSLV